MQLSALATFEAAGTATTKLRPAPELRKVLRWVVASLRPLKENKNIESYHEIHQDYPRLIKFHIDTYGDFSFFPECVARVPVSLGGLGVRLCSPSFAFATATVRNRRQPSATVCVSAVRLSTVASAFEGVQKLCQVDVVSPQLYWCLQRRCL